MENNQIDVLGMLLAEAARFESKGAFSYAKEWKAVHVTVAELIEQNHVMLEALQRIVDIKGSTGGSASMVKEFKRVAIDALANVGGAA